MRHLEIRDLWLQKEVGEGKVEVSKILGTENPADLMTKVLSKEEIRVRLGAMNIEVRNQSEGGIVCVDSVASCRPAIFARRARGAGRDSNSD